MKVRLNAEQDVSNNEELIEEITKLTERLDNPVFHIAPDEPNEFTKEQAYTIYVSWKETR